MRVEVRSLAVRTDLAVLVAAGSLVEDRGDHLLVSTPAVPDYYWGNFAVVTPAGLARPVPEWEAELAAAHPGSRHRALACDGRPGGALLQPWLAAGYEAEWSVVQVRDRAARPGDVPSAPDTGAEIRPLVSDADWLGQAELSAAGEDPTAYSPAFVAGRTAQERDLTTRGRTTWWGAFEGGRLLASLGIVDVGDGLARYQSVKTHPDARRRGLARALLLRAADQAFARPGVDRLVIVADPDYHAADLYRSCGFEDRESALGLLKPPPGGTTEGSGHHDDGDG